MGVIWSYLHAPLTMQQAKFCTACSAVGNAVTSHFILRCFLQNISNLGGVYMTPGRLSPRCEFTPVPSHGSIFVYMMPPENVMPAQVTPAWVHPSSRTGARISLRYEISQRYHVNAKRPPISVWNRFAGRLERVAYVLCLRFWTKRVFYQHEMYR